MLKDLSCIKVVPGSCEDCFFGIVQGNCKIDGFDTECVRMIGTNIFKMEEKWETCTKANTKIGDTVYCDIDGESGTVTHINKYEDYFYLDTGDNETEYFINAFKIKVNS